MVRTRRRRRGGGANVITRNPLHIASEKVQMRMRTNAKIKEIEAKVVEVEKAQAALPVSGSPREIPGLRTALDETLKIYMTQIASLKARINSYGGTRRLKHSR